MIPTIKNPFPNNGICKGFNDIYIKSLLNNRDKIELLKEIGNEVALRNCYDYDKVLSIINRKKTGRIREIYKSRVENYVYLSIDFESGGFELFDHNLQHHGQYSFDGEKIKEARPQDHILYISM